jgi:hypothetical protein
MKKMETKIIGAIAIVVVVIVLLSMTPIVIEQVEDATADASDWNFTGASGAESILGLVPFVWIASILIAAAVGMFALAKST